jgi:hypothetical protein
VVVNRFDQASRYVAKLDPAGFLRWLVRDASLTFHRWLDTRSLPFPGEPDRTSDTVACVSEAAAVNVEWTILVEFQLRPDRAMFGRVLEYLGRLWRERRPPGQRERRYEVGAAVVNLTGRRRTASRRMRLGRTRILTRLSVAERNLAREDAAATLAAVEGGTCARCLLPFVPLMRGGAETTIMDRWKVLAQAEPDARLRGDYGGLALVFADLAGSLSAWKKSLEGWNVTESQQVLEWMAEGEARGRTLGALESHRQFLRILLEERFGPLPDRILQRIEQADDLQRLEAAGRQVLHIQQLDDLQL